MASEAEISFAAFFTGAFLLTAAFFAATLFFAGDFFFGSGDVFFAVAIGAYADLGERAGLAVLTRLRLFWDSAAVARAGPFFLVATASSDLTLLRRASMRLMTLAERGADSSWERGALLTLA